MKSCNQEALNDVMLLTQSQKKQRRHGRLHLSQKTEKSDFQVKTQKKKKRL